MIEGEIAFENLRVGDTIRYGYCPCHTQKGLIKSVDLEFIIIEQDDYKGKLNKTDRLIFFRSQDYK